MPAPTVTMQPRAGMDVPTQIHLPDATTVRPDAAGKIVVPGIYAGTLMAIGWRIVDPD